MHQKNFRKTYYQIRTELFWGMVLCILLLLLMGIHANYRLMKQEPEKLSEDEPQIRMEVTYDDWHSELEDSAQCLLCRENALEEAEPVPGSDTIGLILLNSWTVLNLPLRRGETAGREGGHTGGSGIHYGYTGGITWLSSGDPDRGMAKISLTLPERCQPDEDFIRRNLCQTCLDQVTASLRFWKGAQEDKEAVPLCLLDRQTAKIYSAQDWHLGYFIRDYWIELDFEETEVSIKAYYLPSAA